MCKVSLVPRIFSLPPSKEEERNPGTRLVQGDLSSETQGQIVGARESLNGWKNIARRKVKNGEKSPWGQCLTRPVLNGRRRSVKKTQVFLAPIRSQNGGDRLELVW